MKDFSNYQQRKVKYTVIKLKKIPKKQAEFTNHMSSVVKISKWHNFFKNYDQMQYKTGLRMIDNIFKRNTRNK